MSITPFRPSEALVYDPIMDRPSRETFQGVAIDLANTLDVHGDVLDDPGGPSAWAIANRAALGPSEGFAEGDGRRLVELRAAVRDLLGAVVDGGYPSSAALEAVNAAAALAPGHPQLDVARGRRPAVVDRAQRDDRRRRAVSSCPLDHRTARRRGRRAAAALLGARLPALLRGARRPARLVRLAHLRQPRPGGPPRRPPARWMIYRLR